MELRFERRPLLFGRLADNDWNVLPRRGLYAAWRSAATTWLLLTSLTPASGQLAVQATDFQVNTYTTFDQRVSRVAIGPGGSFVLVWQNGISDLDPFRSLRARFYDGRAEPLDLDHQVNTYTTASQIRPQVAVSEITGEVVVVWDSLGSDGTDVSEASVQGQRFSPTGIPVGGEFQVNSYTLYVQEQADVAVGPAGDFVVVWRSELGPGDDPFGSIVARLFDSAGGPVAPEFQVNTYTPGDQYSPHVGMASGGDFVVVWDSYGSPGGDDDTSVQARRFAADGSPMGGQFQVNTTTTGYQYYSEVDMAAGGEFVVVWHSAAAPGDGFWGVQAQRFAADGSPLGEEIQVNGYTTGQQLYPKIALGPDGSFLVAWEAVAGAAAGSDTSGSVQARHFAADGLPLGADFQVNTYTPGEQRYPSIASGSSGRFVVTWESDGSSGSDSHFESIQARVIDLAVFGDDFESGNTSAWSTVAP